LRRCSTKRSTQRSACDALMSVEKCVLYARIRYFSMFMLLMKKMFVL
jgi:hypothetical protein